MAGKPKSPKPVNDNNEASKTEETAPPTQETVEDMAAQTVQAETPKQDAARHEAQKAEDTPSPAQETTDDPLVRQSDEDKTLYSLDELENMYRVPGWQHAALLRHQDWDQGKQVSRSEYEQALHALSRRPQGGGRG